MPPDDKRRDESQEELAVARTVPSDAKMAETRFSDAPPPAGPEESPRELLGGRY